MKIETVHITTLRPHPGNPRVHPESSLRALEKSISEYGWTSPILISKDNVILAGHARLKAARSLFHMQELEPETYQRIVNRISGIHMAGSLGAKDYFVKELPFMFSSWREYRDYLLENLITDPQWRRGFRVWFKRFDDMYHSGIPESVYHGMINAILCNDWEGIKLENLFKTPQVYRIRYEEKMALQGGRHDGSG